MQHILTDKEYQKLKQKINDLKKHNKALQAKLNNDNKETKTAQEMFEDLGFCCKRCAYEQKNEVISDVIVFRHRLEFVGFDLKKQTVECATPSLNVDKFIKLQKVINKQIDELGWGNGI